jgi:hypothetical protein
MQTGLDRSVKMRAAPYALDLGYFAGRRQLQMRAQKPI